MNWVDVFSNIISIFLSRCSLKTTLRLKTPLAESLLACGYGIFKYNRSDTISEQDEVVASLYRRLDTKLQPSCSPSKRILWLCLTFSTLGELFTGNSFSPYFITISLKEAVFTRCWTELHVHTYLARLYLKPPPTSSSVHGRKRVDRSTST